MGAAILEGKWAYEAMNALEAEMFDGADREIFQAICTLCWDKKGVDGVTLMNALPHHKERIWQLCQAPPVLSHTPDYIRIVQEDWQRAQLDKSLSDIALSGPGTVEDTLESLEGLVRQHRALLSARSPEGVTSFSQAAKEFFLWMRERRNRQAPVTGLSSFDTVVGGFEPGTVFTLAARPGGGKTDFAINLALRLAKRGARVLYFTLEMTNVQIMRRVASYATKINSLLIRDDAISARQEEKIKLLLEKVMEGDRLGFVEEPHVSLGQVARYIDLWKPQVVIIDHIGLMKRPKAANEYKALGEVSNRLKELAIRKKISILQLSQMNRQIESRKGGAPNLSDLRESGDLEQDSDIVAFLIPEKQEGAKVSGDGYLDATLQFSKIREGDQGARLRFKWQPQYHTFTEVEQRQRDAAPETRGAWDVKNTYCPRSGHTPERRDGL